MLHVVAFIVIGEDGRRAMILTAAWDVFFNVQSSLPGHGEQDKLELYSRRMCIIMLINNKTIAARRLTEARADREHTDWPIEPRADGSRKG